MFAWLFSGGLKLVTGQLFKAYELRLKATNDKERIEADVLIASISAQQNVLIAEQNSWMTRWIRPAFALPFVIYNFKFIVWDKALGFGASQDLGPDFWLLQTIVFGAYFGMRAIEKTFGKK